MSPLDSILGLKDLTIERVERRRDIHVWARPAKRPGCMHCLHEPVRIKATHQRTLKHTRQGNPSKNSQFMAIPLSQSSSCKKPDSKGIGLATLT